MPVLNLTACVSTEAVVIAIERLCSSRRLPDAAYYAYVWRSLNQWKWPLLAQLSLPTDTGAFVKVAGTCVTPLKCFYQFGF